MPELLIGCGHRREKQFVVDGESLEWKDLHTLDIDPECKPDFVYDLNEVPWRFSDDNVYDEIHAYEVLEHLGRAGDWRSFFDQFSEIWRILKPGGRLYASVPTWDSVWAWGDPGHTRIITAGMLTFLSQEAYAQVGTTTMTDYRPWYKANFKIYKPQIKVCSAASADDYAAIMQFLLEAIGK